MTVSRPSPDLLVIADARAGALVRLAIWLVVVGIFGVTLLGTAARGDDPGAAWLAALVPLVLLPYLLDSVRVLLRRRVYTFDRSRGELRMARRDPVPFAAIRQVEVGAVNGTCEESALAVRLADGGALLIASGHAFARMLALAEDVAALAGVTVVRRT